MSPRQAPRPARLQFLLAAAALLGAALPAFAASPGESIETRSGMLPVAVTFPSAVWTGQYAYVFGGLNQATTAMNTIVRYDPATDTALNVGAMPTPRYATSAIWDGTTAYVFGGIFRDTPTNNILAFDPATGTALDLASPKLPCPMGDSSAFFDGSKAYIIVGAHANCQQGQIVRFDPTARTVAVMNARLPMKAVGVAWDGRDRPADGCDDGCAYIFGGVGSSKDEDTIYRYNPKTDTLTTMQAQLPTPRASTVAFFDGARAYILGGMELFPAKLLRDIVWFDPVTDTSGKRDLTLPTTLDSTSLIWDEASSFAYTFGGYACTEAGPPCYSAKVLRYHPPSTPPALGPPNVAPVASFSFTTSDLLASVDAGESADSDGAIASYAWEWGDGSTGAGVTASHTYASAGTYTVRLTVTDNASEMATTTRSVTVTAPAPNQAPTASFTLTQEDLTIGTDATASMDADGSIASYAWTWGDGATGTGPSTSHTYTTKGTYTVRLTVTDDDGATGTTTRSVTVAPPATNPPPNSGGSGGGGGSGGSPPPPNQAPTASFTLSPANLSVTTDASASNDPDGWLTTYAWTWGDGATGAGVTASHTYASAGTYTVRLTVTDAAGATATTTRTATVTNPPPPEEEPSNPTPQHNAPPVAQFALGQRDLDVWTDGAQSFDTEGPIAAYAWTWGDNSPPSTGPTASHTYATAGTYTVRLTVTDEEGATANATRTVTVTAPPTPEPPTNETTTQENATPPDESAQTTPDDGTAILAATMQPETGTMPAKEATKATEIVTLWPDTKLLGPPARWNLPLSPPPASAVVPWAF